MLAKLKNQVVFILIVVFFINGVYAECLQSPQEFSGTVIERGDYEIFDINGACDSGTDVLVERIDQNPRVFVATLFDENNWLMRRDSIYSDLSLEHILRDPTAVSLGITVSPGTTGGDFNVRASKSISSVPTPSVQRVFLDFDGATGIRVHGRQPIDILPLEQSWLANEYPGQVQLIKEKIIETMAQDFEPYDVIIYTSDDGSAPLGPHASIYFGGNDDRLLGLADNVDQYNEDPWQTAVVYIDGFADFSVMGLTAEEMGRMIGNVASHELGHLLGLFHTQLPEDIMDTTGTAWDLAGEQDFLLADLEASVFPIGKQNSPNKLEQTVGYTVECNDNIDNDNDGAIDYPQDFSCVWIGDDDETIRMSECQDGIDNDYDGTIDYPADLGCSSLQGRWESPFIPQCQDGIDNDGDTRIDYPQDLGCLNNEDDVEADEVAQCQDGIDNDGDEKIDYPQDIGCASRQDDNEYNPSLCYDSDGGKVFDVVGYVTDEFSRNDDSCYNNNNGVREYYCNGDNVAHIDRGCIYVLGYGSTCNDGACRPGPQCNNYKDDDSDGKCDYQGCSINNVWKPADLDCVDFFDETEKTNGLEFYYKNGLGANLQEDGDIYLRTGCMRNSNCVPPNGAFIVYHPSGDPVAYISQDGQMCIEGNSCTNKQPTCAPQGNQDFVVYNEAGTPKIVIDINGNLCYTGDMTTG